MNDANYYKGWNDCRRKFLDILLRAANERDGWPTEEQLIRVVKCIKEKN
jgi:hypothetical protein